MTMPMAFIPEMADRQYVSRKEGGRGLLSTENSVDALIQQLEDYNEKSGGRLITATRNNTKNMRTSGTTITRKQKWEEKQLTLASLKKNSQGLAVFHSWFLGWFRLYGL